LVKKKKQRERDKERGEEKKAITAQPKLYRTHALHHHIGNINMLSMTPLKVTYDHTHRLNDTNSVRLLAHATQAKPPFFLLIFYVY